MIKGAELLQTISPQAAEKLIKNQEQINQLHETLSVLRLDKQNALVRRLVKKTQDGTLGQPGTPDETEDSAAAEEDAVDDDKVTFGDTTTTYNLASEAKEAVAKAAPALWPYVLAAALGGTGLGASAFALPLAWKALNAEPVKSVDTDTDMTLDLQFKEEETK